MKPLDDRKGRRRRRKKDESKKDELVQVISTPMDSQRSKVVVVCGGSADSYNLSTDGV